VLQRRTKGFDIEGVKGKNVVPPFAEGLGLNCIIIDAWQFISSQKPRNIVLMLEEGIQTE
jgi:hypothetical protein